MSINNIKKCPCTKIKCPRHGNCKACMEHHKDKLPACKTTGKLTLIR